MRLIDILNKIANGELKEGTKVKVKGLDGFINEYKFVKNIEDEPQKYDLQDSNGRYVFDEFYLSALEDEVELIEPQEPKECEHEWSKYSIGRLGRTENYRKCKKCGIHEEDIEPTDNTKIEELDILEIEDNQNIDNIGLANSIGDLRNEIREIQHKLNEVIRKLNKED